MVIEIPDWCSIGRYIMWHAPHVTGYDWVREKIISFGNNGFFHQGAGCPVYFSKFSDYGSVIKEVDEVSQSAASWVPSDGGYVCSACGRFEYEVQESCRCGCKMNQ